MADKPIKLTDAQLTTLQQVADPNYKKHGIPQTLIHEDIGHYNFGTLKSLQKRGLVVIAELYSHILGECIPDTVHLTDKGREFLGIAPIPLAPPPKTDKERIAELEAALQLCKTQAYEAWQQAIDIQKNGGSAGGVFNVVREGLVDVIETVKSVLGSEE